MLVGSPWGATTGVVGRLVGWLIGRLVRWLVRWLIGRGSSRGGSRFVRWLIGRGSSRGGSRFVSRFAGRWRGCLLRRHEFRRFLLGGLIRGRRRRFFALLCGRRGFFSNGLFRHCLVGWRHGVQRWLSRLLRRRATQREEHHSQDHSQNAQPLHVASPLCSVNECIVDLLKIRLLGRLVNAPREPGTRIFGSQKEAAVFVDCRHGRKVNSNSLFY